MLNEKEPIIFKESTDLFFEFYKIRNNSIEEKIENIKQAYAYFYDKINKSKKLKNNLLTEEEKTNYIKNESEEYFNSLFSYLLIYEEDREFISEVINILLFEFSDTIRIQKFFFLEGEKFEFVIEQILLKSNSIKHLERFKGSYDKIFYDTILKISESAILSIDFLRKNLKYLLPAYVVTNFNNKKNVELLTLEDILNNDFRGLVLEDDPKQKYRSSAIKDFYIYNTYLNKEVIEKYINYKKLIN
jgi:hypothetical protein